MNKLTKLCIAMSELGLNPPSVTEYLLSLSWTVWLWTARRFYVLSHYRKLSLIKNLADTEDKWLGAVSTSVLAKLSHQLSGQSCKISNFYTQIKYMLNKILPQGKRINLDKFNTWIEWNFDQSILLGGNFWKRLKFLSIKAGLITKLPKSW